MHRASEQRIYVYPIDLEGKLTSPAQILLRTVWGIIEPFHTWGYIKWQGEKVPVRARGASIWENFNPAMDTDWERVPEADRSRFEGDLALLTKAERNDAIVKMGRIGANSAFYNGGWHSLVGVTSGRFNFRPRGDTSLSVAWLRLRRTLAVCKTLG
ncbi:hypothetical protein IH992_03765 [Candidatus Poribacteria bacterium]|nr:hypothetical protein [Candidatus Poribacteria bacterium]